MPPPPAAEPARSGTTGSGVKGDCGPLRSAPPRRPRSRRGLACAAGEAERTRGARCATPLGPGQRRRAAWRRRRRPRTDGRAAAGRLPCHRSTTTRRAGAPAGASTIGVSAAGAAGLSGTAMGVASSPGTPGLELVAAAGSASAAHVQFHTQFQPARGALAGARQARTGPVPHPGPGVGCSGRAGAARRGVGRRGARAVARRAGRGRARARRR